MSISDEVRASAAAHRDLGPGYDTAVAEGLVERIGEEIDRRVDARLHAQAPYQTPPPRPRLRREPVPGRMGFGAVVLALGSMGMAIGATAAVLHPGDSPGPVSGGAAVLIALIWIVIGVVNVAYARYRQLFVPMPGALYGALMSSDHEAEIRASVAAHADLGPGYDDAVAEGLVERIGAEIDKRIDARLAQSGPAGYQGPAAPPGPSAPAGYQGYQGYLGPVLPPGYQLGPPPVRPSQVGARNVATTITALGSMALGVGATAILSHAGHVGGQGFIILIVWVAIAIVNVAYARRP